MQKALFITGPTAVGKTGIGVLTAKKINGEIISADSRQFYRYMNIGTAKPSSEEMGYIPHFFIDILDPDEYYSAGKFGKDAREKIKDIFEREKIPVIVGGSGLYLKAVYEPLFNEGERDHKIKAKLKSEMRKKGILKLYEKLKKIDPKASKKIMPNDEQRILRALEVYEITGFPISDYWGSSEKIDFKPVIVCLNMHRELLYEKINKRVDHMIQSGFIEEVKELKKMGFSPNINALKSVGYKEIFQYFDGHLSYDLTIQMIKQKTRNYAKRQLTWFKKEKNISWIDTTSFKTQEEIAENVISIFNSNRENRALIY